jgi:3-hydroxyacyl-CoA dehydrogenase
MPPYTRVDVVDGVAVITIDNPPVNALGPGVLEAVEESVARGVADPGVRALVLVGAGATFVAGADINIFKTLTTRGQALERSGVMHAQLRRIEDASKPVVAAIHGHALGGGLELAMACHYRIAEKSSKVGQPEVLLGLIPGAGGTQRLPRLCGPIMALDMCTLGEPVAAPNALAAGILDRIVDGDRRSLIDAAVVFAREQAVAGDIRRTRDLSDKLMDVDAALRAGDERRAALEPTVQSPAQYAAVNAVEAACMLPFDAGSALERELFADCVRSDASRALVHLFFAEREAARVPGVPPDTPTRAIRRAAVLGAGTIGVAIAMTYADANIPVLLKDVDQPAIDRGLQAIRGHYQSSVSNGQMTPEALEATMALITPTTTFDAFDKVDIVTEAVFEDLDVKKSALADLGRVTRADCLFASSTSTLDIDELARASARPSSVIGHHFVSARRGTKLIEIVRGRDTSREAIATSLKLSKRLGKVGIVVGNCKGFVATRLFASYVREAGLLLAEGAFAPQIDRALTRFGLAVGPFAMQEIAAIDVPRIRREAAARREVEQRAVTDEEIVDRITTAIANEGARVLAEGCASRPGDIDIIYCYAFGFPRARGGPMYYANYQRQGSNRLSGS